MSLFFPLTLTHSTAVLHSCKEREISLWFACHIPNYYCLNLEWYHVPCHVFFFSLFWSVSSSSSSLTPAFDSKQPSSPYQLKSNWQIAPMSTAVGVKTLFSRRDSERMLLHIRHSQQCRKQRGVLQSIIAVWGEWREKKNPGNKSHVVAGT